MNMKKFILFLVAIFFMCGCVDANVDNPFVSETATENLTTTSVTTTTTTITATEVASTTTTTRLTTETTQNTTTTQHVTTTLKTTKKTTTQHVASKGQKVYKTPTGKKYHYNGNCGNGTYIETTLEEALRIGLEPCKKCVLN